MKAITLPNGREIYHIDSLTALYIYNEIFEDHVYLQNDIAVNAGDIVLDVGANIGLFSIYMAEKVPGVTIFGFEPVPQIFEVLQENCVGLDADIHNFNVGLSDTAGEVEFFYYPHCSGDSTPTPFDWDRKVRGYVDNYKETVCDTHPHARLVPPFLRRFVMERSLRKIYRSEKVTCRLITLSQFIKDNSIERIDLLKCDAENCEKQVLDGIDKDDWKKIRQVAMEVHAHIKGYENLLEEITALLQGRGFTVRPGKKDARSNMGVHMLYARR